MTLRPPVPPEKALPVCNAESEVLSTNLSQPKGSLNILPPQPLDPNEDVLASSKLSSADKAPDEEGCEDVPRDLTLVDPGEFPIDMSDGLVGTPLTDEGLPAAPGAKELSEKANTVPCQELAGQEQQHESAAGDDGATANEQTELAATRPDIDQALVAEHFERENLQVLADDTIRRATDLNSASHRDEMGRYLKQDRVDDASVVDHIVGDLKRANRDRPVAEIRRGLRRFKKVRKKAREAEILEAIFRPLSPLEQAAAANGWTRLGTLFESVSELAIAVIMHFMWQVGQKVLGRSVAHHLMAVIYSRSQGSGKTTFVMRLIGPMQELASDPVALNDIADIRSGSIFEFPVIPVDDMEKMDPKKAAPFKAAMTANAIRRRRLGTSSTVKQRQRATFIGTANHTADDLVMDDTGNRRFVTLTFRNGNTETGGAADVWETVSDLNYLLLWRSVDPFKPSPLAPHLGALAAYQSRNSSAGRLRAWAVQLDLNSDPVANATERQGIPSRKLWQLYVDQTDSEVSETWFSRTMSQLTSDPMVPFGDKYSTGKVRVWPIKADHRPAGGSA